MKTVLYIVFFIMMNLLKNCSTECTEYYLFLKKSFELVGDEFMPNILPVSINDLEHDSIFNLTENAKILQDNKKCILELECGPHCQMNSVTSCFKPLNISTPLGTDVHETAWTQSHYSKPTKTPLHTDSTTTVDTTDPINTSTEAPITKTSVTKADIKTADTETSSIDFELTTEYATKHNESELSANRDKKEIAKTAAIAVVGASGVTAVTYFIAKKIQHLLQYGAYHLPAAQA